MTNGVYRFLWTAKTVFLEMLFTQPVAKVQVFLSPEPVKTIIAN